MTLNVLITGSNRGIGLSLCKQYKNMGHGVFAACRKASSALQKLNVEIIDGIDLADETVGQKVAQQMKDTSIDLLINNAGILRDERLGDLNMRSIEEQFNVNTLGPLRITEALLPRIKDGGKIAFITSRIGSIQDNTSGGRYGYRMSKCALNAAAVSVAHDVQHRDISVAILHPGLVGTDMIGGSGNITPDQAALQLSARIEALCLSNSGSFWHADGSLLPW